MINLVGKTVADDPLTFASPKMAADFSNEYSFWPADILIAINITKSN
jgi:hypothetical protein